MTLYTLLHEMLHKFHFIVLLYLLPIMLRIFFLSFYIGTMTSKKSKCLASSINSFDRSKLISARAVERYNSMAVDKNYIPERGFNN